MRLELARYTSMKKNKKKLLGITDSRKDDMNEGDRKLKYTTKRTRNALWALACYGGLGRSFKGQIAH